MYCIFFLLRVAILELAFPKGWNFRSLFLRFLDFVVGFCLIFVQLLVLFYKLIPILLLFLLCTSSHITGLSTYLMSDGSHISFIFWGNINFILFPIFYIQAKNVHYIKTGIVNIGLQTSTDEEERYIWF